MKTVPTTGNSALLLTRLALLSFCLASLAAPASFAGEAADAAADAEALLRNGAPTEIWDAFDRAVELFWAEAPMSFRTVALVESVDGYGQYVLRSSDVFAAGDTLTAYLEPQGYGWTAIGDQYRIRFTVDVAITSLTGETVAAEDAFATIDRLGNARRREFEATVRLTLPALPPGAYALALTFHDAATGKAATATIAFVIGG